MTNDEINEQTPEAPATSQESTTSPMSEQEAVMGYDEQIAALKAAVAAVNQETPEQKKKRERMEKSQEGNRRNRRWPVSTLQSLLYDPIRPQCL